MLLCRTKDFSLGFQAGQGTKYAQVPMKPKKYTVAKGEAPAGQFDVIGHDWGASIAWNVALSKPDTVDRLVILSVPHPTNMMLTLRDDPAQQKNSNYARNFQKAGSEDSMTAQSTSAWVRDPEAGWRIRFHQGTSTGA